MAGTLGHPTDKPARQIAIRAARAREHAWALAGSAAPETNEQLIPIHLDATIVISHSDKENTTPTWKKTFGFHPVAAFADHGTHGAGALLAHHRRQGLRRSLSGVVKRTSWSDA
ncbi:hypothetical protein [Streptosporangium canum]|uniref:hypothetical protein n=1 Tax=Streptosporangium canum TaxID=324952 RepID=UPI0037B732A4